MRVQGVGERRKSDWGGGCRLEGRRKGDWEVGGRRDRTGSSVLFAETGGPPSTGLLLYLLLLSRSLGAAVLSWQMG